MNMFDELNDTNEIVVPGDLEIKARGRIQGRVRKQRVVAALLSSILVIAFSGVAYAVVTGGTSGSGKINTVDQNKRDGVSVTSDTTNLQDDNQDETVTSIVTDSNGNTSIVTVKRNDDSQNKNDDDNVNSTNVGSSTVTTSVTTNTVEDEEDEDSSSTTEVEDHSGSGS